MRSDTRDGIFNGDVRTASLRQRSYHHIKQSTRRMAARHLRTRVWHYQLHKQSSFHCRRNHPDIMMAQYVAHQLHRRGTHLADLHSNTVSLILLRARQQNRANNRHASKRNRSELSFVSNRSHLSQHVQLTQTYFRLWLKAHCVPFVAPAITAGVIPGILVVARALGLVRKMVTNSFAEVSGRPALMAYSAT